MGLNHQGLGKWPPAGLPPVFASALVLPPPERIFFARIRWKILSLRASLGAAQMTSVHKAPYAWASGLLLVRLTFQGRTLSMALFAPKCDRCGKRTRNTEEDKPVCQNCVEEMTLLINAAKEESRPCPRDASPMIKEIAHMLVIDRCPECRGVWLDGGELERLREGVQMEAVMATTRGLTSPLI